MDLKNTIIHESQKLFSLKGFGNTGINDIIEAAGTSKGGFYNHFASKEELFYEVLSEAQQIWRERVLTGIRDIDSPTERIIQICHNYKDRYLKDSENFPGGCIFITLSVELDDQNTHLAQEINQGFKGFRNLLKNIIMEGIQRGEFDKNTDPEDIARCLFTGMLGASVLYGINKSNSSLDETINCLIKYLRRLQGA
jgi:TetR/AcrR family transcriptional repressor of nem operon